MSCNPRATDFMSRLRALGRGEHDDVSLATEAADEIDRLERIAATRNVNIARIADERDQLRNALRGLMPFHLEDELGPQTRQYWAPAYRAAFEAAEAALGGTHDVRSEPACIVHEGICATHYPNDCPDTRGAKS